MSKNEKGFSWVEGLVVILVLAAIGLGGWYVMNRNAKDDTKQPVANEQAAPNNQDEEGSESEGSYLTITEWDLKFKLPDALKSMEYAVNESGMGVLLDSDELAQSAGSTKNCGDAGKGLLGSLSRKTDDSAVTGAVHIKQVGDYHYFYGGPQVACLPADADLSGDSTKYPSVVLQEKARDQLQATLPASLVAAE